MLNLTADLTRLLRRSRAITRRYPDVARRAANSTAFYLREQTPKYLEDQLDRPTKKTAKASSFRVDQARGSDLGAVLRAIPQINAYLRKLEFGLRDDFTSQPIAKGAFDRYGNIVKKAHLTQSSKQAILGEKIYRGGGKYVGRFFFGDLRRPSPIGLYERWRGNREVRLFAVFERDRQNKPSLRILDEWKSKGTPRLRAQLGYWTKRFLTDPDEQLPRDLR